MAGLVDAQELQGQQVRVIAFHHGLGPGHESVVDLVVVGDGCHCLHVAAEGVHQVGYSHQLSGHPRRSQRVEDGLALHAKAGNEVASHPVSSGRCAGKHGTEPGDGAGRVHGGGVDVVHALAAHPIDERRVRFQQPVGPTAIYDYGNEPLAASPTLLGDEARGRQGRCWRPGEEPLVYQKSNGAQAQHKPLYCYQCVQARP